ncbi:5'-nucleotidase, lipoprotein e(P4) family [Marinicella sp. W31]|uniref:5'-nucleotidase, lipoprotein e(P4) family n=1 Tax=Marinicella sp. W31 TaxID=3023713 RepID=UPI003757E1BE
MSSRLLPTNLQLTKSVHMNTQNNLIRTIQPFVLILALLSTGCANRNHQKGTFEDTDQIIPIKEHLIMSVLWQQNSAEYKALCYQAFNQARAVLDRHLENTSDEKPLAIITDIDETILDNSPYSAQMILRDENYERSSWIEWGKKESAKLVPGAGDFLTYAASKDVEVFYISNRLDVQMEETLNNLKALGMPDSRAENILLRTSSSGKEPRREQVSQTHNVVLHIGDNLSDFHESYDEKYSRERNSLVDSMKDSFGTQYIVLPNPMYGDWETKGLYENKYNLTEFERRNIRRQKLILP